MTTPKPLTCLNEDELARITGGMTPGAAFKILTTCTKAGMAAETEQPAYKARQEAARQARTEAAVNQMKATTPNWQEIVQPHPFAPTGPTLPPGLLRPHPFPGHPQVSKGN